MTQKPEPSTLIQSVNSSVTVFLVAREGIFFDGLIRIINEQADIRVAASATPADNPLRLYKENPTELLIMEESALQLILQESTPLKLFNAFREIRPDLRIIVFGRAMTEAFVRKIIQAGVHGIIDSAIKPKLLGTAILTVANGCYWLNWKKMGGRNRRTTIQEYKPGILQGLF